MIVADNTAGSISSVAKLCGVSHSALEAFYRLFAVTERTITLYSMGVNQSSQGTDKANSIINCHLLSGRIGKPGMGPFSITGQPNAMGGREVGGLATCSPPTWIWTTQHTDIRYKPFGTARLSLTNRLESC